MSFFGDLIPVFGSYLPIGIDVGASGVRLIQLRRRGRRLEVVSAGRIEIPEDPGGPAAPSFPASVAAAIRPRLVAGFGSEGFVGSACVLSLDDRLLRVRSVRLPRMPDDELDRAIGLDAHARLGFGDDEAIEASWLRAGEVRQGDEFRDEVILVGTRRDHVERLVMALAGVGLRPIAVEPGFVAAARAFTRTLRRSSDQVVARVLVGVGLRSSSITIVRGQAVALHKSLEAGGRAMTLAAAESLGLEPQAVLDLRRRRAAGGTLDPRVDRALHEAVRPIMADIANEVSLCLRYYGVSFRGSRVESCVLHGGEAMEPRFIEILANATHLPVSIGRPLAGIGCGAIRSSIPEGTDAPWGVATGLSLRGLRQPAREAPERRAPSAVVPPSDTAGAFRDAGRAAA